MVRPIVTDNATQKQSDAYSDMVKTREALVHALGEVTKVNKQLAEAIDARNDYQRSMENDGSGDGSLRLPQVSRPDRETLG